MIEEPVSRQARPSAYADALAACGAQAREQGVWLHVGETALVQGWKLHLSTIPLDAEALLDRVLPLLLDAGAVFKLIRSPGLLMALNAGELGDTQIGKAITIYPRTDDDAELYALAEALVERTRGLRGPAVPTDAQLGEVVFTRYGGIHPEIVYDRLGDKTPSIRSVSGELIPDRYTIPFQLPDGRAFPFETLRQRFLDSHPGYGTADTLIGPGYRVMGLLNASTKGSVFLALDLREQGAVRVVALKQGRHDCYSDLLARDACFRLRRQAELHHQLSDLTFLPRAGDYFVWRDDGYLPLDYIEGRSIEAYAGELLQQRRWNELPAADRVATLDLLIELAAAVAALHQRGLVHRDLSANNLLVTRERHIVLLDLELAHEVGDLSEPLPRGTPGFMSPNQDMGGPPVVADDIYSLGSCAILALTGMDPQRVLFGGFDGLPARLQQLTGMTDGALAAAIALCFHPEASARPPIADLRAALQRARDTLAGRQASRRARAPRQASSLVPDALLGLFSQAALDVDSGLWLSHEFRQGGTRPRFGSALALMPDANRGVAGVIYLLARAARRVDLPEAAVERLVAAAQWLTGCYTDQSGDGLPGLHFGRAGAAVALAEAAAVGIIQLTPPLEVWIERSLSPRLDWPDITHGAAGIGVAALTCADLLGRPTYIQHAVRCAEYLVGSQAEDGSWPMPSGVASLRGEALTGFAHGVAGVIYFLAEMQRRGRPEYETAWRRGVEWLLAHRADTSDGRALEWPYSDRNGQRWQWWCHGAPGIALMFLRLLETTGDRVYGDLAARCLPATRTALHGGNLTQCHGLSGLGEIYLEAARVLNRPDFRRRAGRIADDLYHLARRADDGSLIWLTEETTAPTADLMVGAGGVVHFFLKWECEAETLSFPLLL